MKAIHVVLELELEENVPAASFMANVLKQLRKAALHLHHFSGLSVKVSHSK